MHTCQSVRNLNFSIKLLYTRFKKSEPETLLTTMILKKEKESPNYELPLVRLIQVYQHLSIPALSPQIDQNFVHAGISLQLSIVIL